MCAYTVGVYCGCTVPSVTALYCMIIKTLLDTVSIGGLGSKLKTQRANHETSLNICVMGLRIRLNTGSDIDTHARQTLIRVLMNLCSASTVKADFSALWKIRLEDGNIPRQWWQWWWRQLRSVTSQVLKVTLTPPRGQVPSVNDHDPGNIIRRLLCGSSSLAEW